MCTRAARGEMDVVRHHERAGNQEQLHTHAHAHQSAAKPDAGDRMTGFVKDDPRQQSEHDAERVAAAVGPVAAQKLHQPEGQNRKPEDRQQQRERSAGAANGCRNASGRKPERDLCHQQRTVPAAGGDVVHPFELGKIPVHLLFRYAGHKRKRVRLPVEAREEPRQRARDLLPLRLPGFAEKADAFPVLLNCAYTHRIHGSSLLLHNLQKSLRFF